MFSERFRNILIVIWLVCLILVGLLAKFGPDIIENQAIEEQKGEIF